jgi:hypothetical protein
MTGMVLLTGPVVPHHDGSRRTLAVGAAPISGGALILGWCRF